MTLSEIIDCINKLENEYDFVNFKIYEIDIWPLLRIILYGKLHASEYIENNLSIKNDNKYNNIWIKRIKKLTKVVSILKHFDTEIFNLHKKDIIFLSDGVSLVPHNKYYIDRICYPIEEYIVSKNLNTLTIFPKYTARELTASKSKLNISSIVWLNKVKNKLINKIDSNKKNDLKKIIIKINKKLGAQYLEYNAVVSSIENIISNITVFKFIFKKVNPKIVFVVEYYSAQGQAISYVSRLMGIKCIDLQHGSAYQEHPAYSRWESMPFKGYNIMPSGFYVTSDKEKKIISKWFKGEIFVGANIYLEQFKIKKLNDSIIKTNAAQNSCEKYTKIINKNKKKILVALQPGLLTVEQIIKYIQNNEWTIKYSWLIRLHPRMIDELEAAKSKIDKFDNIEIECSSKNTLLNVLSVSDLHITHCSHTILEATSIGVPSIILHYSGIEITRDFVKKQYYIYVDGLIKLTERQILSTIDKKPEIYEEDSINKLKRAYDEIDSIIKIAHA